MSYYLREITDERFQKNLIVAGILEDHYGFYIDEEWQNWIDDLERDDIDWLLEQLLVGSVEEELKQFLQVDKLVYTAEGR